MKDGCQGVEVRGGRRGGAGLRGCKARGSRAAGSQAVGQLPTTKPPLLTSLRARRIPAARWETQSCSPRTSGASEGQPRHHWAANCFGIIVYLSDVCFVLQEFVCVLLGVACVLPAF